jgi:hypothetical protein
MPSYTTTTSSSSVYDSYYPVIETHHKPKKKIKKPLTYTKEHVVELMKLSYLAGYEGSVDLMEEEIEEIIQKKPKEEMTYPTNLKNMVKDILSGKRIGEIRSPETNLLLIKYNKAWVRQSPGGGFIEQFKLDHKKLIDYNLKQYYKLIYGEDLA